MFIKYLNMLSYDLSVSNKIMELHGGTLGIDSEGAGMGAVFYIDTPAPVPGSTSSENLSKRMRRKSFVNSPDAVAMRRFSFIGTPPRSSIVPVLPVSDPFSFVTADIGRQISDDTEISDLENFPTHVSITPFFRKSFQLNNNSGRIADEVASKFQDERRSSCENINNNNDNENNIEWMTENRKSNSFLLKVLLVDDARSNRKMLARILKTRCLAYEEACDGLEAVNIISSAMEQGYHFDVILMDFVMPNMDGPTATKLIRELKYRGIIIGVTGNAMTDDINTFLCSGADRVMTKPFDIEVFDNIVSGE